MCSITEGCESLSSGVTRYDRENAQISFALVCDGCGTEQPVGQVEHYVPSPKGLRQLHEALDPILGF